MQGNFLTSESSKVLFEVVLKDWPGSHNKQKECRYFNFGVYHDGKAVSSQNQELGESCILGAIKCYYQI